MSDRDEARRRWFRSDVLPLEPELRRYARRFARRGACEVDDLLHETFARLIAYEHWETLTNVPGFATRVLKNVAIDQLRREKNAAVDHVGHLDVLTIVADQPGPELEVLSRDELRRLVDIVADLPERVRQVFTLRKIYELSHSEIADRLGLSVSTVEKHLAKGLRICSEKLSLEPRETATRSSSWRKPQHRDERR